MPDLAICWFIAHFAAHCFTPHDEHYMNDVFSSVSTRPTLMNLWRALPRTRIQMPLLQCMRAEPNDCIVYMIMVLGCSDLLRCLHND